MKPFAIWAAAFLVMAIAANAPAGVWIGDNVVLNGNFSEHNAHWTVSAHSRWGFPSHYSSVNHYYAHESSWVGQAVSVTAGKRYKLGGDVHAHHIWAPGEHALRGKIRFRATNIATTAWVYTQTPGHEPEWRYVSATGIATSNDSFVTAQWAPTSGRYRRVTSNGVDNVKLQQIVYDPQSVIVQDEVRTNSTSGPGLATDVTLDLQDLSFADAAQSYSINWGDGNSDSGSALPSQVTHHYDIATSANSHTLGVSLAATNQAGSCADDAQVTILRSPLAKLAVNGQAVLAGDLVKVRQGELLALSLAESTGFIEQASFVIPSLLDVTGPELAYSDVLFGPADIGSVYSLTAGVSNTGLGVNASSLAVGLEVLPQLIEVGIDIKPGSETNPLNLKANGMLPVGILGSDTFDVSQVDQTTVSLAGASPEERGNSGNYGALEDVNGDGFMDLMLRFLVPDLSFDAGATEAMLTGSLLVGGTDIIGSDLVRLLHPGDANDDGLTNLQDFTILKSNFGLEGKWDDGDFNEDGTVNLQDFTILKTYFGQGAGGIATVPEPASAILLCAAGLAVVGRRRFRRWLQG